MSCFVGQGFAKHVSFRDLCPLEGVRLSKGGSHKGHTSPGGAHAPYEGGLDKSNITDSCRPQQMYSPIHPSKSCVPKGDGQCRWVCSGSNTRVTLLSVWKSQRYSPAHWLTLEWPPGFGNGDRVPLSEKVTFSGRTTLARVVRSPIHIWYLKPSCFGMSLLQKCDGPHPVVIFKQNRWVDTISLNILCHAIICSWVPQFSHLLALCTLGTRPKSSQCWGGYRLLPIALIMATGLCPNYLGWNQGGVTAYGLYQA